MKAFTIQSNNQRLLLSCIPKSFESGQNSQDFLGRTNFRGEKVDNNEEAIKAKEFKIRNKPSFEQIDPFSL